MAEKNKWKTFFIGAFLWVCVISYVVLWAHFALEARQARREVIYLKARQMAAEQKRQEWLNYQKRLKENNLRKKYQ